MHAIIQPSIDMYTRRIKCKDEDMEKEKCQVTVNMMKHHQCDLILYGMEEIRKGIDFIPRPIIGLARLPAQTL